MARIIGILLLLPFAYGIGLFVASEWGGEVVELETVDARGARIRTSLWIVEGYDDLWLRAGSPEAAWLQRLRARPDVRLTRSGETQRYRAVVVPDFARRINGLMRERYGLADRLISTIHDPDEVVAVRLERPGP
ncbi:MAG TPA: hypothetical protein VKA74_18515 [Myxococcota bacterium]|nr:hypothetical protein [Myxococcota bacterium]